MKKGKSNSQARRQAKIKRRARRKEKLNVLLLSKIRPLLIKMEQLKSQLKFAQGEKNGSKEERQGEA